MSGEGVIPSDPDLPFGRSQTGRDAATTSSNPLVGRGPDCLRHTEVLPREGGVGVVLPASSSPAVNASSLHQTKSTFGGARS